MKYLVYVFVLILSGCGTINTVKSRYFNQSLLDTAPKDSVDVKYPDWGSTPKTDYVRTSKPSNEERGAQHKMSATNQSTMTSLVAFLNSQHISYDILPGNFPIVRIKRDIQFPSGSDNVSYESRAWIFKLSDYLSQIKTKNIEVVIDGHTDSTGSQNLNDKLSRKRAMSVKALLSDAPYVSVDSIYTRGYSQVLPQCNNISQYGRACNRRVEIFFIITA